MNNFNNILCVLDQADDGLLLARAAALAASHRAQLKVVRLLDIPSGLNRALGPDVQVTMRTEAMTKLEESILPWKDNVEMSLEVLTGKGFLEVIRSVLRDGHDLVIKQRNSDSRLKRFFSSDDMHLLRKCPCPVWLTSGQRGASYQRVLAAVDFQLDGLGNSEADQLNERILDLACLVALADAAELHIAHAWEAPAEMMVRAWSSNPEGDTKRYLESEHALHRDCLEDLQARLKVRLGHEAFQRLSPRVHLRRGLPSQVIPEVVKDLQVDLMVMGTVARAGIAGLIIGNTAESILNQVESDVLAVKPSGYVSPVRLEP